MVASVDIPAPPPPPPPPPFLPSLLSILAGCGLVCPAFPERSHLVLPGLFHKKTAVAN
jgi:hypothetical protein